MVGADAGRSTQRARFFASRADRSARKVTAASQEDVGPLRDTTPVL